ncbi:unnamed protein product [Oikopleura dioica]|uniref:Gap junction protein n=1 Tax=Oikopleura dioica TaxID=34765 RepID=E4X0Y2_OIKDI|nr:unnamed protein product [Oikopleura dioica]
MSWHFLERWLERANQHSTLIGKFWITYLIVCRMVIIGSIGDRVYADEQSEFRCNTQQPGCVQVCYNKFAPISHVRFWGFQLMCVTMPSVGFIVYSGHKAKVSKLGSPRLFKAIIKKVAKSQKRRTARTYKQKTSEVAPTVRERGRVRHASSFSPDWQGLRFAKPRAASGSSSDRLFENHERKQRRIEEKMRHNGWQVCLAALSFIHGESTFGILQLWLFGYKVKELFKCQGFPCPHVVDCFISRPAEKTIFLNFMLGFTIFCVILNLMEFKYLCFLFFKARVKLTAKRSHPILPKPSSFRNFPAYEPLGKPLGFDMPDPRPLNQSPKGQNQLGLAPPPPMHPQSYVDVDAAAASTFGNGHFATSAGDAEKRESRWNLPKKKS